MLVDVGKCLLYSDEVSSLPSGISDDLEFLLPPFDGLASPLPFGINEDSVESSLMLSGKGDCRASSAAARDIKSGRSPQTLSFIGSNLNDAGQG